MYYEDSVIERSTVNKLLWNLLPLLCLLSIGHVLDRLDLTYAAPNMDSALKLTSDEVRSTDTAFYLGWLVAGLPAAAGMLFIGARRWIAAIVIAWGVISMAQAVAWSVGSLEALRFLLGMAEANLMPAMVFFLAEWMPPRHRSLPIAVIVAAAALVPVIGELLANLVQIVPELLRISEWRWLFLVEGIPAVWLGMHVLDVLPQNPPEANFLPHPERHWLIMQLRDGARPPSASRFRDGLLCMPNWKLAAARVVAASVGASLGIWVPLAMQQTDYLPPATGAEIMDGATVLGALAALVCGLRWNNRLWLRRALAMLLALAGIALLSAALLANATAAVAMIALVTFLMPPIVALTWVLAPYLLAGSAAAAGFALIGMAGALGNLGASILDAVRHDATIRCIILAAACVVAAWLSLVMDRHRMTETAASAPAGE